MRIIIYKGEQHSCGQIAIGASARRYEWGELARLCGFGTARGGFAHVGGAHLDKDFVLAKVRIAEFLEIRMAKVTSKYQVTVPRTIAKRYNIYPGDEIDWVAAGEVIRVVPPSQQALPEDRESQLRLFDQATERQRKRPPTQKTQRPRDRGWRREDLYGRGRSR